LDLPFEHSSIQAVKKEKLLDKNALRSGETPASLSRDEVRPVRADCRRSDVYRYGTCSRGAVPFRSGV